MVDQQTLNRIKRMLIQIETNAKKANNRVTWSMSHSCVISQDTRGQWFDVASRPYGRDFQFGEFKEASPSRSDDMRHIATCNPNAMLRLVADIRNALDLPAEKVGE